MTTRRLLRWSIIGALLISAVMLADVGRILSDVESDGQRAFGPKVFTGFTPRFWMTADLADAIALWRTSEAVGGPERGVLHLLGWHLLLDALVFAPAYCLLILAGLRRLGASTKTACVAALIVLSLDELETWATFGLLVLGKLADLARWQLILLQGLSLAKWLALAAIAVIAFVLWRTPEGFAPDTLRQFVRSLRSDKTQHPLAALAGILTVAVLFVALVVIPGGGPLDQIPDVLRRQIEGHQGDRSALWSVAAVVQLAACIAVAAWWVTNPLHALPRRPDTPNWKIIAGVAVVAVPLAAVASYLDHAPRFAPLASLLVVLGVYLAAKIARLAGIEASRTATMDAPEDRLPRDDVGERERQRALWAGGISGAIFVAAGLGLVRAAFPPFVLGLQAGRVDWSVALIVGIVLALFGGFVAQLLAMWALPRLARQEADTTPWRYAIRATVGLLVMMTLVSAGRLALSPEHAGWWGTTGVITIAYAVAALAIGGLTWVSRARAGWEATYAIGLGWRTPWLTLVLLTWVVASVLNTEGVYHDARVAPEFGRDSSSRHQSPSRAFEAWIASQRDDCVGGSRNERPLVLVAAPGGGIRAAYWTAAVLDSLIGARTDDCALRQLFAISGVSGGSVGAATWLVARSAERSGATAVESLAGDSPLAATAAGLLLRDTYQPFLGIATAWSDRAALLEDGWIEASKAYLSAGSAGGLGQPWSKIGGDLPWVPILILNSSSVNDGCRILIANTRELASTHGSFCGSHQRVETGSISSATQPLLSSRARLDSVGSGCVDHEVGFRIATAALLSARFPLVSPSGAVAHCVADQKSTKDSIPRLLVPNVTYAVDGGYYENTGLLTLLQLWSEVEPLVRQKNREAADGHPKIVPWIIVIDNHYRSAARIESRRRPYELLAPLRSLQNKNILGQAGLEEMARLSMRATPERCADSRTKPTGTREATTPSAGEGPLHDETTRGCFLVIAPAKRPSVTAPLGWVLSSTSMSDLQSQLHARMQSGRSGVDRSLARLLALLGERE